MRIYSNILNATEIMKMIKSYVYRCNHQFTYRQILNLWKSPNDTHSIFNWINMYVSLRFQMIIDAASDWSKRGRSGWCFVERITDMNLKILQRGTQHSFQYKLSCILRSSQLHKEHLRRNIIVLIAYPVHRLPCHQLKYKGMSWIAIY